MAAAQEEPCFYLVLGEKRAGAPLGAGGVLAAGSWPRAPHPIGIGTCGCPRPHVPSCGVVLAAQPVFFFCTDHNSDLSCSLPLLWKGKIHPSDSRAQNNRFLCVGPVQFPKVQEFSETQMY